MTCVCAPSYTIRFRNKTSTYSYSARYKGEEKKGENIKEKGRKGKEKGRKGKEKGRKGKEKGRKGKETEKRGSKRVKLIQNREELRQKGHDGSKKMTCCKRRKITFSEEGGNKYRFRTKI
jgi:hypothetical protein